MKLEEQSLHDSNIKLIEENPETDMLIFHIDWPRDWKNNMFVDAYIIFEDVLNYEVHEGAFLGNPTILQIHKDEKRMDHQIERQKITIETNAGYRSLFCTNFSLIEKNKISKHSCELIQRNIASPK